MANMSYCRFQNTLSDLEDCQNNLDDPDMSDAEQRARKHLIKLCREIVEWDDGAERFRGRGMTLSRVCDDNPEPPERRTPPLPDIPPEVIERAREMWDAIPQYNPAKHVEIRERTVTVIAQALQGERNKALEEAAGIADAYEDLPDIEGESNIDAAYAIACEIRRAKSEVTVPALSED